MTPPRPRGTRVVRAVAVVLLAASVASCTRLQADVYVLAHDALAGRDNGTPGSASARTWLVERLDDFAVGANPFGTGAASFLQPFSGGTNVVGVIPGGDLADEYVLVGAHYDHVGSSCGGSGAADAICNGATDNATGVAAVLEIGRAIAAGPQPPRRSVILAFWDREEDGLLGAQAYVQSPLRPLADTVAYVNYDIQGANLLPGLRTATIAVGAETGGPGLRAAVAAAASPVPLDTKLLSLVFGQGRSDHARFVAAQVPSVFFTDATGPCYHDVDDEFGVVDFRKLERQVVVGTALVRDLANRPDRFAFAASNPLATFADAVAVLNLVERAVADLARFPAAQRQQILSFRDALAAIVADGEAAFGPDDVSTLLSGAAGIVNGVLTWGPCDGFLAP